MPTGNGGLDNWGNKELPVEKNRFGEFLGDHNFAGQCQLKFSRRKEKKMPDKRKEKKRIFDQYFESPDAVIQELEEEKDFRFGRTSLDGLEFKRLRGELPVRLKDRCGLMYSQIKYFPMFEDLKHRPPTLQPLVFPFSRTYGIAPPAPPVGDNVPDR